MKRISSIAEGMYEMYNPVTKKNEYYFQIEDNCMYLCGVAPSSNDYKEEVMTQVLHTILDDCYDGVLDSYVGDMMQELFNHLYL